MTTHIPLHLDKMSACQNCWQSSLPCAGGTPHAASALEKLGAAGTQGEEERAGMSSGLAALSLSGQDAMQTLSSLCKGAAADAPVPLFSAAASGAIARREDSRIRATFQASLTVRMRFIHPASRSASFLLSTTRSMLSSSKSRKQHTAALPRGSAQLLCYGDTAYAINMRRRRTCHGRGCAVWSAEKPRCHVRVREAGL